MKFNWGTGIVIAIVMFISFIMYMVVTMISTKTDIVEKDYYTKQIAYQATKDAKEKGLEIANEIIFEQTAQVLKVQFPVQVNVSKIESGEIHFYRPENASLDRRFIINTEVGNIQPIAMEHLQLGNYVVKIKWKDAEHDYFVERNLKLK